MNDQFLQGVIFDWNRIDNDSYLKRIKAFKGIQKLDFNKAITFFVGAVKLIVAVLAKSAVKFTLMSVTASGAASGTLSAMANSPAMPSLLG